jgi:hypothetical protein
MCVAPVLVQVARRTGSLGDAGFMLRQAEDKARRENRHRWRERAGVQRRRDVRYAGSAGGSG